MPKSFTRSRGQRICETSNRRKIVLLRFCKTTGDHQTRSHQEGNQVTLGDRNPSPEPAGGKLSGPHPAADSGTGISRTSGNPGAVQQLRKGAPLNGKRRSQFLPVYTGHRSVLFSGGGGKTPRRRGISFGMGLKLFLKSQCLLSGNPIPPGAASTILTGYQPRL